MIHLPSVTLSEGSYEVTIGSGGKQVYNTGASRLCRALL